MIMRMLRFLLRWTFYTALALAVAVLALLATVLVANSYDDALDADVQSLLSERAPQVDPQRNGYFAWIGVMGPETVPPHEWGQRWHQEALAMDAALRYKDSTPSPASEVALRQDVWPKDGPCRRADTCFSDVAADVATVRTLLEKAGLTLARADAAIAYPEMQEPVRPDFSAASPAPRYPRDWQPASAARFVLDVREGRHGSALARLAREHRFHVAHASGAVTLIDKVVTYDYLKSDYLLLADYLHRYPEAARGHTAVIESMLIQLPAAALSLAPVLRSEARVSINLLLNLDKTSRDGLSVSPGKQMMWVVYQPQASANAAYQTFAGYLALEAMNVDAYRSAIASLRQAEMEESSMWSALHVRNPVGHILVSIGTPGLAPYLFRRDDLRVLQGVLAHRLQLLKAGQPASEMAAQVVASDLIHAYTGESPHWDEATQSLVYAASPLRKDKEVLAIKM